MPVRPRVSPGSTAAGCGLRGAYVGLVSEGVDTRGAGKSGRALRESGAGPEARTPVGPVWVVDAHPSNWLYITWNTMEEPVRTDETGAIAGACMKDSYWEGATFVVKVREGVQTRSTIAQGLAAAGLGRDALSIRSGEWWSGRCSCGGFNAACEMVYAVS